jgi:hypothetical protein
MKTRLSLVQLVVIFLMLFYIVFGQPTQPVSAAYSCFTLPDRSTHTIAGVVNSYFPGTVTASAGAISITVGPGRGADVNISSGDLLLVIQMQDADINYGNTSAYGSGGTSGRGYVNINSAGLYEYVVARGAVNFSSGGTVTIEGKGTGNGLLYTYTNGNAVDPTPYPTPTTRPGNQPTSTPRPSATPPGGNYYAYHGQHRFQVIRVPAYLNTSLNGNISAAPWDGYTGGIVALETVDVMNLASYSINVDGLGFRGGGGRQLTGGGGTYTDYVTSSLLYSKNGSKGEGIAGSPRFMYSATATPTPLGVTDGYPSGSYARGAPGNAGGGGTDGNPSGNDQNSGGGGGSNGGAGGQGGYSWSSRLDSGGRGGIRVTEVIPGRIVLGGGGGAGTTNNGTGTPGSGVASSGAAGGGSVFLRAGSLSTPGTITANGSSSLNVLNDSTGGGGAGGSVVVLTNGTALTGLSITANGGNGGNAWPLQAPNGDPGERHGPGGGGGGGVVFTSSSATISVSGGANGTTTNVNDAYGATSGDAGVSRTNITATEIPGAEAGFLCYSPTSVELHSLQARSTGDNGVTLKIVLVLGVIGLSGIWLIRRKK